MRLRPRARSSAIAIAPKVSINGELMAAAATERKLARNSRCAAVRKRATSHDSMPKALTMRFPVIVSCKMFCTSAIWSWPRRVVDRTRLPMRTAEKIMKGTNSNRHPGKLTTQDDHHYGGEQECEELLQEFGQHARHGELDALNVVDDGRDQCPRCVFLKEGNRAPQDRVVEIVAQVGDHAEAGMVDEIGPGVVQNSLQHGRCN